MGDYWARKAERERKPAKIWKEKFKDPIVWLTAVLALFTGALAVVSVLQWLTLEKTDETFWAGQRPWIGVSNWQPEYIYTERGELHERRAHLSFQIQITNFGNMPALDVQVQGKIVEGDPISLFIGSGPDSLPPEHEIVFEEQRRRMNSISEEAENTCQTARHYNYTGSSIFPKQSITREIGVYGDMVTKVHVVDSLIVIGCVTYKFGHASGLTPFQAKIRRKPIDNYGDNFKFPADEDRRSSVKSNADQIVVFEVQPQKSAE
jgi:hypothetical protein